MLTVTYNCEILPYFDISIFHISQICISMCDLQKLHTVLYANHYDANSAGLSNYSTQSNRFGKTIGNRLKSAEFVP